jgi:hypothetical protein
MICGRSGAGCAASALLPRFCQVVAVTGLGDLGCLFFHDIVCSTRRGKMQASLVVSMRKHDAVLFSSFFSVYDLSACCLGMDDYAAETPTPWWSGKTCLLFYL